MELARVEFDFVPGDAIEASLHLNFRNPVIQKQRRKSFWMLVSIGIMCCSVAVLGVLLPQMPMYLLSLIGFGMGIMCISRAISLRGATIKSQEKLLQKFYDNPQCAGRFGPQIITVFPDYLQVDSSLVHLRYHWPAVTMTDQTDDYLFVMIFGSNSIPIPRDAFPNDDDFERFCEVVHQVRTAATAETTNRDA